MRFFFDTKKKLMICGCMSEMLNVMMVKSSA